MDLTSEKELKSVLKEEISRLKERSIAPSDIPDDELLFDVDGLEGETLGLDSLDALEIAMSIEDQYGVVVPEDIDFKDLMTVDSIVAYVLRLRGTHAHDDS